MNMKFSGVIPILVTPFNEDESVDTHSIQTMIRLMQNIGVQGITILGVLGEANRLSDNERELVISSAIEAAGQLPVIVGTSAAGTRSVINHNQLAKKLGASAVMITPQAEAVPSDEKVFTHFHSILNETDLPVVLQDHPASTGVHMATDLIFKMLDELTGFCGVKLEAVPTAPKLRSLKTRYGNKVSVMTGLGALYGAFDLEAGSDGFNTGFAFPEVLIALTKMAKKNDWDSLQEIYQRFLPLIVYEQHPGVAIRKELLKMRGAIRTARVRSPGVQGTDSIHKTLSKLIQYAMPSQDITRPVHIQF
jgi:4-hydroxy-tetrahydrodipicolinate synthase